MADSNHTLLTTDQLKDRIRLYWDAWQAGKITLDEFEGFLQALQGMARPQLRLITGERI